MKRVGGRTRFPKIDIAHQLIGLPIQKNEKYFGNSLESKEIVLKIILNSDTSDFVLVGLLHCTINS